MEYLEGIEEEEKTIQSWCMILSCQSAKAKGTENLETELYQEYSRICAQKNECYRHKRIKQLQIRWVERLARCRGTLTAGLPFYLSGEGRRTTEIWALGRKTEGKKWKKGKSGVERRDLNKKRETNKGMKCSQDRSAEKPTHKWKSHSFSSHPTIINQWKTPLTMTVQSICHKVMKIISSLQSGTSW